MAKRRIERSFVALITPMNTDGSVDFEGFRTLLNYQEQKEFKIPILNKY